MLAGRLDSEREIVMGERLAGRKAIITGAGNGIGRATALLFAAEGAAVMCADIDGIAAGQVADEIDSAGGMAAACICDVADSSAVRSAVDAAVAAFGGVTTVMANAAVYSPSASVADMEESDWRQALDVNLTGAFLLCKYAIPHLRLAGGGSMILTASQMGRVANANSAAYCATKGALIQLAKAIAIDHAGDNIRANTLSPGGTATDRMSRRFEGMENAQRDWGPRHLLNRLGTTEEMAAGALFLASDESSFMTGADLLLDGGYTAV
jgi:NAD(P)-dependent dehydrogenase (short-subunit alcohol dehydrogenase family)